MKYQLLILFTLFSLAATAASTNTQTSFDLNISTSTSSATTSSTSTSTSSSSVTSTDKFAAYFDELNAQRTQRRAEEAAAIKAKFEAIASAPIETRAAEIALLLCKQEIGVEVVNRMSEASRQGMLASCGQEKLKSGEAFKIASDPNASAALFTAVFGDFANGGTSTATSSGQAFYHSLGSNTATNTSSNSSIGEMLQYLMGDGNQQSGDPASQQLNNIDSILLNSGI